MIVIMSHAISSIFDGAIERSFDTGEMVFRAGGAITHVHLVRQGCAVLVRALPSGDTAYLQRALTNDLVAEASVYAAHYHCDCLALQPTVLAVLPRTTFQQVLRLDIDLSETWAAYLAGKVQRTRMQSEIRSLKTVSARLDAWIAEFGPLPGKGAWQGVAHEISVSREALYRELGRRRLR